MPSYYFIDVWTPLQLIGIKIFKDDDGNIWIKFWHYKRRKIALNSSTS